MTAIVPQPRHGDVRNARIESTVGPVRHLFDQDGQPLGAGPLTGHSASVAEAYCAHCQTWIEVRGIMGGLLFAADHFHGETGR